ncbi:uncharacterized protein LOC143351754 [Colletes latitarsis]|uniref:uncharacterized protein LOC143351754 n=1 Tax=Colletes latitarsis TaxID=2605962 RepID=UPI00403725D6
MGLGSAVMTGLVFFNRSFEHNVAGHFGRLQDNNASTKRVHAFHGTRMRARFRTFTCTPIKIVTELIMGLFSTNLHKPCTPSSGKSDLDAAESTLYPGIQRRDIR